MSAHDRRFDSVNTEESVFDLGNFNPIPTNLHLKVLAPREDQAAIAIHRAHIACEIQPLIPATRISNKGSACEFWLSPIPERQILDRKSTRLNSSHLGIS